MCCDGSGCQACMKDTPIYVETKRDITYDMTIPHYINNPDDLMTWLDSNLCKWNKYLAEND